MCNSHNCLTSSNNETHISLLLTCCVNFSVETMPRVIAFIAGGTKAQPIPWKKRVAATQWNSGSSGTEILVVATSKAANTRIPLFFVERPTRSPAGVCAQKQSQSGSTELLLKCVFFDMVHVSTSKRSSWIVRAYGCTLSHIFLETF